MGKQQVCVPISLFTPSTPPAPLRLLPRGADPLVRRRPTVAHLG
jgi:hypothetical protein